MSDPGDRGQRTDTERDLGRGRRLMMAALDGELSLAESSEWQALLEADPDLREEWKRLHTLKEVTQTMELKRPPEEVWDEYEKGVYQRLERSLGWILLSIGSIVLLSWGAWSWIQDLFREQDLPSFARWAILAVVAGLVILFVSVVREKLFVKKTDPYKEVVR